MALSDTDATFLEQMIEHHQAALDMSRDYLQAPTAERGAVVTLLAQTIIKAQTAEIAKMRKWLADDDREATPRPAGMNM